MKKDTTKLKSAVALTTVLYALSSFLLRSYQLKWELLYDGSLVEGAFVQRVLPLISICFLLGMAFLIYRFFGKLPLHSQCFAPSVATTAVQTLAAVVLIGGNLYLPLVGRPSYPEYVAMSEALLTVTPWAGILAGVCLMLHSLTALRGKNPSPLYYMAVSLYLVMRLLICFQEWNTDPSVHHYAYQLLAVICSMLGAYRLAGFGFDKGRRGVTLFFTLGAVLFCTISIADLMDNLSEALINVAFLLSMGTSATRMLFAAEATEETVTE